MSQRLVTLAAVLAVVVACGNDSAGGGGEGGSGGVPSGGGAGGAPLTPADFVDPADYDCGADAAPVPPARPYTFGCVHDPSCASRFVAAHRMGTTFAPENSLSALRASILVGADIAETDVRLTADGRAVLVHDAEVDRTLDGTGKVNDLTLAEIQAMPMTPKPADPAGADFSCDRAPTVEEALAVGQGKIVIEFETKETAAGIATAEILRDAGLYEHAYVQCSPEECDAIRAAVPDVPIMVRVTEMDHLDRAEAYAPPPVAIEIDATVEWTSPEVLDRIHAVGAKAFTNAFYNADVAAILGDLSLYEPLFEKGLDVLQSEFPHLALYAIGRIEPK